MLTIAYQQLNPAEKTLYERFSAAFHRHATSIDAGGVGRNVDAMKVLLAVLGDEPAVTYFDRTQLRRSASLLGGLQLHLIGVLSPARARQKDTELEAARVRALEEIGLLNPITGYDKLICIYEYLQDHVRYDQQELEACCRLGRSPNPDAHNAYGALVKGSGVCDGIASAFCLLAQSMGFPCTVVGGEATFLSTGFSEHSWNVLQIGPRFYHVDATWDVNRKATSGEYAYDYFCVSDDTVSHDHQWPLQAVPACTHEDASFYRKSGCFANNLTQLEEIFTRYAKSRQTVIRARLAEGIAIPAPEEQHLASRLQRAASAAGRHGSFRFSWNPRTRCFFAKFES